MLTYTLLDFNRKTVGKPTIRKKINEFISGDNFRYDAYFGYQRLVNDGYDLIIGPGCSVYGEQWPKAIYCRNYEEILNKSKSDAKSK